MEFKTEADLQEWMKFLRTLNTKSASDRIRMMREHAGMTQKQLAAIVGCQANVISQMENNQILNKETRFIYSICRYFHCSMDWLLCESNAPAYDLNSRALSDYLHLNPDTMDQLVSILRNVSETGNLERRGLNHIVTADPDAFADLCRCIEEYSRNQCLSAGSQVDPFAQFQLGRAWIRIQDIFQAAYVKEKDFRETRRKATDQILNDSKR